jgi:hypothetical protein
VPCSVSIERDDMVVRLQGWPAVGASRRRIRIPLRSITDATVGRFDGEGWKVVGAAIPFTEVRYGSFRGEGKRQFLAFTRRDPVLVVRCDRARGAPFDVVALQLRDPESVRELLLDVLRRPITASA